MTDPPAAEPQPRTCEATGLRLVPAGLQRVYRIQKPSWGPLNPPVRAGDLTTVGDWGRWDVAGHRTVYAASPRRYAYQEVLAYLTPARSLQQTGMNEVFDDVDEE
jgi:hypothetical protein